MVRRFDSVRLDSATKLKNGFLKAKVSATRVGVFHYMLADGTIRKEFRPPEEVFRADSMASLACQPLTDEHPDEMIDSDNARYYICGYTGENPVQNGQFLDVNVTVVEKIVVEKILLDKKDEVSCGYTCDTVEEAGEFEGEAYDYVQKNIVYNHLARTDKGRAGPDVRIRMDAMDGYQIRKDSKTFPKSKGKPHSTNSSTLEEKKDQCMKFVIDGVEYENSDKAAIALQEKCNKLDSDNKELQKKLDSEKTRADSLNSKTEELTAKVDAQAADMKKLEAERMDDDKMQAAVMERRSLEKVGSAVCPSEVTEKFDSMSSKDIKLAVIKADSPDFNAEGKSEDYVQSRFDHISERIQRKGSDDLNEGFKGLNEDRVDSATTTDAETARKEAMKKDSEAWKQPLS